MLLFVLSSQQPIPKQSMLICKLAEVWKYLKNYFFYSQSIYNTEFDAQNVQVKINFAIKKSVIRSLQVEIIEQPSFLPHTSRPFS